MISYGVISIPDKDEFQDVVNNYLKSGWKLHGNLIVIMFGNSMRYIQAVIFEN